MFPNFCKKCQKDFKEIEDDVIIFPRMTSHLLMLDTRNLLTLFRIKKKKTKNKTCVKDFFFLSNVFF